VCRQLGTKKLLLLDRSFAWSGAGIDLATARPTPEQIGVAVQDILTKPTYRTQVQRLKHEFAQYDALNLISSRIETLLDRA
jgi:UDP:flavonoid glycosyltransferase YjiC (YdhE family)